MTAPTAIAHAPHLWGGSSLPRSDLHFRQLLEKLPAGAYTCDPDGLITYFNPHAVRLWGRAPRLRDLSDRFCGSFRLFLPDGTPVRHEECWMALALRNEREYNGCEIVIEQPDGERLYALAHASPIHDEQGVLIGAVNVLVDISAQKQAEAAQRQFEAQLLHAQKLESLGVMAGGIAHDFNNLLTAVLGYASLAALELPAGSVASLMLEEIEAAAQRAAELAGQMLTYSGRAPLMGKAHTLDKLVQELAKLLTAAAGRKAALVLDLQPAAISGDAGQLGQVLLNLVTNAAEACDGTQEIRIRTGVCEASADTLRSPVISEPLAAGAYAYIEVADTGCGIAPELLPRIFDPFFTTKFTGRGLGLAAVAGIVKSHHGSITVQSQQGQGTTVRVFLPVLRPPDAPPSESSDKDPPVKRGTLLLVDDEASVRGFARRVLERAGFAVLEAEDGRAGLELFAQRGAEIHAVVLDLTMPRMDGLAVLRSLRRESAVPVLLLSGYAEADVGQRDGEIRPDAFLQKPFRPQELIAKIDQLLSA